MKVNNVKTLAIHICFNLLPQIVEHLTAARCLKLCTQNTVPTSETKRDKNEREESALNMKGTN
jgi:hypothetical protein